PCVHLKTFKIELNHLVELGVLTPATENEWALPSFIVPKKDQRVCWIIDLHYLNKVIRCKQYPLPITMDILHKCSCYKFFTKHDTGKQYYTVKLDECSQDLCTIITPFGTDKYLRHPMGLKCSPDIAQSIMESVLVGIDDADAYIDDVGVFSQTWDHKIKLLRNILCCLCENGFTINP
ncbi:hypothetical protein ACHAW6_000729, partial [Cyclotella cf. meneghiniana]